MAIEFFGDEYKITAGILNWKHLRICQTVSALFSNTNIWRFRLFIRKQKDAEGAVYFRTNEHFAQSTWLPCNQPNKISEESGRKSPEAQFFSLFELDQRKLQRWTQTEMPENVLKICTWGCFQVTEQDTTDVKSTWYYKLWLNLDDAVYLGD